MRKVLLLFFAMASMSMLAKEYAYQTVEGDPLKARIYKLDNGLTVYLTQNRAEPEIQTFIVVRAGSQNDPLESTGLAHYQEHIMFKGTKSYGTTNYQKELPNLNAIDKLYEEYGKTTDPDKRKAIYHLIDSFSYENSKIAIANEFDKLMSGIGATAVNAYTSTDQTCYHEVIPSGELTRWAMIESDRFRNLVIRGFHTELETVYEEFNMYSTYDFDKVDLAINQVLYPNIPYRQHTVLGTQEDLKNPSIKNIRKFYDTYYRPNNVAICLSGDFEYDHAIKVIDAYFGKWEPRKSPAPIRYQQADLKVHKDTVVFGKEAPEIYLAWKMPDIKHADIDAIEVMDYVLQNGRCGLMDVDIIQKQQLLSVRSMFWTAGDYSTYFVSAQPKEKQKLEEVRQILLAEIEKLKKGEFDADLIPAIIRNKKRSQLLELQYNVARVQPFINAHIYQIPYEDIVHEMARKEKVTKEDIVRVANTYFRDNYVCVFKEHNENSNPPKMEKPGITPIEMNREATSEFYDRLMVMPAERCQPQFLDFDKDVSRSTLPNGVELLYRQNTENDLSDLVFIAPKGIDQAPQLDIATDLLGYLGTAELTTEQYKKALYAEAAEAWVSSTKNETQFYLYGLKESLPKAMSLMEDHVLSAKPDDAVLKELVNDRIKSHNDEKKDQMACYSSLREYGYYGADVQKHRTLTPKTMQKMKSAALLADLRTVVPAIGRVVYYGPLQESEVKKMLASSKLLAQADASKRVDPQRIQMQQVQKSEVLVAPFKANNAYIAAYANWGEVYNPKERAIIKLFNEYFDGSMGGIVFQEMRESKALCYGSWAVYANANYKGECNYITKGVLSQNDKMEICILTLDSICNVMPISQTAFDNAKEAVIKQIEQRRFVRDQPIWSYIDFNDLGWDHDIFQEVYDEVKKLTLADVVKFQQEHVANRTYRYMVLGDPKELDMKFLKTLGPVKVLSLKDIFVY
ncbi:MAG: insulinase family protein [Paludibacteraceae bacterium]|nr:insulinase family protein [Paludibacteraceae bacterium]